MDSVCCKYKFQKTKGTKESVPRQLTMNWIEILLVILIDCRCRLQVTEWKSTGIGVGVLWRISGLMTVHKIILEW